MTETFFKNPILNSPYEPPAEHWELDEDGQPTGKILSGRRRSTHTTPVPRPKKRKGAVQPELHLSSTAMPPAAEAKRNREAACLWLTGLEVVQKKLGIRTAYDLFATPFFKPATGRVEPSGPESIACWFIDTDHNEESFFVRHAYFLGMNGDPYKALKTSLKAEVDREAWESLYTNVSRPFPRPASGRIAVKVINHLGDEVMKVYEV